MAAWFPLIGSLLALAATVVTAILSRSTSKDANEVEREKNIITVMQAELARATAKIDSLEREEELRRHFDIALWGWIHGALKIIASHDEEYPPPPTPPWLTGSPNPQLPKPK